MDVEKILVQMSTDRATFLMIIFTLKLRHWHVILHRAHLKEVPLLVFSFRIFYEF
jgi:hypothetical protein